MDTSDTLARIRNYVDENFLYMRPDFDLGDNDCLLGRGVIDSMGITELIEFLGVEFGIEVEDAEITEENLGTLSSIASYVQSKRVVRQTAS